MSYLERLGAFVEEIRAAGRYRSVETHQPSDAIDFSSNDYLAMATDPLVIQAFRHATRVGAGGSRLLGGRHREHSLLEEELAQWLGRERALLFSSGYHAAIGAIPVLARAVSTIYSDALNHASLIDGIRLAHADRRIYPHGCVPERDARTPALVISESIFSMDGDAIDVAALLATLGDDDVLLLDEAHALGVVGPAGAGCAAGIDDPRIVVLGTLSKSFGAQGGFIAGPSVAIEALINAARSLIFDTALAPALALAARVALVGIRNGDERRRALHANVARMRSGLASLGLPTISDPSPIVPVVLGGEERALRVSRTLLKKRLYAPAIRPPTVPPGSSRLRVSLRSDHHVEHVDLLIEGLAACIATS